MGRKIKTKRSDKIIEDNSFDSKKENRKKTKKDKNTCYIDIFTYFTKGKIHKFYVFSEKDLAIDKKF